MFFYQPLGLTPTAASVAHGSTVVGASSPWQRSTTAGPGLTPEAALLQSHGIPPIEIPTLWEGTVNKILIFQPQSDFMSQRVEQRSFVPGRAEQSRAEQSSDPSACQSLETSAAESPHLDVTFLSAATAPLAAKQPQRKKSSKQRKSYER